MRQTSRQVHVGPDGHPGTVGTRSVYRWLATFEAHGFAGLENKVREVGTDGVLDPCLVAFVIAEKTDDPRASIPELLRRAVIAGLLETTGDVDRTTVWTALKRRDVHTFRQPRVPDQRKFAHAHRLQLVLCDGKQFRAGPNRAKRVALFFIDDATRYIPEVVVGPTETSELFLRGLHRLLSAVGRIDGIYVDHDSGFIAICSWVCDLVGPNKGKGVNWTELLCQQRLREGSVAR